MQRRSLNCRSENARHPFRATLSPATLAIADIDGMPQGEEEQKKPAWWRQEDTHLFLLSFSAFFVVFYTFIA